MSMVGHKTESIFRRYAIVDQTMQRKVAARLEAFHARATVRKKTGTISTFKHKAAKVTKA